MTSDERAAVCNGCGRAIGIGRFHECKALNERAAVPVVWCPECKTGNAPYDDLGCCCKCLCPVEPRHVCTDADMRVLEAMAKARIIVNKAGPRMNYLSDERNLCRAELARRGEG